MPVVVADGRGRITLFNPAAEKIFGVPSSEVLGQPLERLIPGVFGDESRAVTRKLTRWPRGPSSWARPSNCSVAARKAEEFPLELSLSAVESNGELQYIGSIRDQTERQRMRAMLVQSEKLASIGLLSAGVAHEINNPLAYVGNNLAVLERDLPGCSRMIGLYERRERGPGVDIARSVPADQDVRRGYRLALRPRQPAPHVGPDSRGSPAGCQYRPESAGPGPDLAPEDGTGPDRRPARIGAWRWSAAGFERHNIEIQVEHAPDLPRIACVPPRSARWS